MIILQILGIVLLVIIAALVFAYIFKPELLMLPYSWFISIFVRNPPFVDIEKYFPAYKKFEENFDAIRKELEEVLKNDSNVPKFHDVDPIQRFISATDDVPWRTYAIKAFDHFVEPNLAIIPTTTRLIRETPEISLAMFSILDPGKKIPPHFGFFRGVFRYHLGLIIPPADAGECYIVVGGQKYQWQEGKSVLFDDTYSHNVLNATKYRRVVLFCDIIRDTSLPKWIRPLNRKMYELMSGSKRVQKAAKRAEVIQNI